MLLTDVFGQEQQEEEEEVGRMEGQEEKVREKAYLLCKEYLQVCTACSDQGFGSTSIGCRSGSRV